MSTENELGVRWVTSAGIALVNAFVYALLIAISLLTWWGLMLLIERVFSFR